MYCSYCAGLLDPSQSVCPKCGRPVPAAAPVVAAPPVTAVAAAPNERPQSVSLAALLLVIALGFSVMSTASILLNPSLISRLPASFYARTIGFLVLGIVLLVCIWQRQAWARIALILVLVWGIGNLLVSMLRIGSSYPFMNLFVPILVDGLRVAAVYLLFRPASNAWFRK
jgi:hypothetical protein